jgi:hypothetical protein
MILGPNAIAGSWGYTIGCKSRFNARLVKAVSPCRLSKFGRFADCVCSQMIDYGIDSLEPTTEAFAMHNEQLQKGLDGTTMVSTSCDNWWRVGGNGLLSVPNSVSGCESTVLVLKRVQGGSYEADTVSLAISPVGRVDKHHRVERLEGLDSHSGNRPRNRARRPRSRS